MNVSLMRATYTRTIYPSVSEVVFCEEALYQEHVPLPFLSLTARLRATYLYNDWLRAVCTGVANDADDADR